MAWTTAQFAVWLEHRDGLLLPSLSPANCSLGTAREEICGKNDVVRLTIGFRGVMPPIHVQARAGVL
jgi:hypothetical protein